MVLAMFGRGRSVKVDAKGDAILFKIGLKYAKRKPNYNSISISRIIVISFLHLNICLKGHLTTSASSPDFFFKKLRFLYHWKCIPM